MLTNDGFVSTLTVLVVGMVLLTAVETLVPLVRQRNGYRLRVASNLGLVAATLVLTLGFNAGTVLMAAWFRAAASPGPASPGLLALGVIALDGATYVCHRMLHAWPWLWRAHRVHHSDVIVDATTTFRQHPVETLVRFAFIVGPAWVLGLPPDVVAAYRTLSVGIGLLEHANVRMWHAWDRALAFVISTPNMHKVHHSRLTVETNSNYGNILSAFDRVCGTFAAPQAHRTIDYGLDGHDDERVQRLRGLLALPFDGDEGERASERARARIASLMPPRVAQMVSPTTRGRPNRSG